MNSPTLTGNRTKSDLLPSRLVESYLANIARRNSALNAYIHVDGQGALERGHQLDHGLRSEASPGEILGAPLAIKDIIDVAGQPTTAASNILRDNAASKDAAVILRLRQAGAVFLGKTNLHEFAYGGSGVISSFGPVRNPWDPSRITGGSSSGSAAAVAAGMCIAAIGTDTAGSIRLPASFCGIVGFKPTYGRVSIDGVIPLSVSYDHVGPMTQNVADARLLFQVLTGETAPSRPAGPLRIGIAESFFYRDLDSEVGAVLSSVQQSLEKAGHKLVPVDFPVDEDRTLAAFESYNYHAKWVERSPELYQPATLRRIKAGENITREDAADAAAKLKSMRDSAAEIFTGIDILLTPTVPVLPPSIDELLADLDELRRRELLMLRNTRPFNVLGVPAISIPWTLSQKGLPIGIQLAAAPAKDFELLDIAQEFERLSPWQGRTPLGY